MRKRQEKYPATVAFRTTNEFKKQLEQRADQERKSVSELLQEVIKNGLVQESAEYKQLVIELAKLRGKGEDWIRMKINTHRKFLIDDAHHGYCEEVAIEDIKEDIKRMKQ